MSRRNKVRRNKNMPTVGKIAKFGEDRRKNNSKANCQILHDHLVHIENEDENFFLRNHLRTLKDYDLRIGLTDSETEGVFKWIGDNSTASFTNWSPRQTDSTANNENCVHFNSVFKGNDRDCGTSMRSICVNKLKLT